LIVTSGVESYRHVLGPVIVDEEEAPEYGLLGIEKVIGEPVGTNVGGGVQLPSSSVLGFRIKLLDVAAAVAGSAELDRFRLVAFVK